MKKLVMPLIISAVIIIGGYTVSHFTDCKCAPACACAPCACSK